MPISRQRLPRVACQASPSVSRRPIAAAAVTWAIIPVTSTRPIDCRTVPSPSEPREPIIPASSLPLTLPDRSRERSTDQVSAAVTRTGISIETAATRTAEPTVAFGLKRMMRNAASYMSDSPSGRNGIAPGLWAAPSMPAARGGPPGAPAGAQGAGPGAGPGGGGPGGRPGPGGGYHWLPDITFPLTMCVSAAADGPILSGRGQAELPSESAGPIRFGLARDVCQDSP